MGFILLTPTYKEFCRNGIRHFLHDTPLEAMASAGTAEAGRRKTWLLACEWEGINPQAPSRLPFLRAIDTALEIPDGFKHVLDNNYASRESGVLRATIVEDVAAVGAVTERTIEAFARTGPH